MAGSQNRPETIENACFESGLGLLGNRFSWLKYLLVVFCVPICNCCRNVIFVR